MTLRLRQARVTDIPLIYRGEQDYIRCREPDHEAQWRLQLERHLSCWVENFERLTVAVIDTEFVGYSMWSPDQGLAELCTINVSQSLRRKGIGRALLNAYVLHATRLGFTHLTLSVRHDNPAQLMYARAGFVCVGTGVHNYLRYELRGDEGGFWTGFERLFQGECCLFLKGCIRSEGGIRDYQRLAGRVLTELEVDVKSPPQKTACIARRSFDATCDDCWSAWVGQKHIGA